MLLKRPRTRSKDANPRHREAGEVVQHRVHTREERLGFDTELLGAPYSTQERLSEI
jgi:hypothetical protein